MIRRQKRKKRERRKTKRTKRKKKRKNEEFNFNSKQPFPCMVWKIKQKPEDFVVREVLDDRIEASWKDKVSLIRGKKPARKEAGYLWFTMRKRNVDFFTSINSIAKKLNTSTKSISYSGTKDKRAVTSQTLSVNTGEVEENEVKKLKIPGLEFSDFRYSNRPVRLGEHNSNSFTITVRNIPKGDMVGVRQRLEKMRGEGFVNFFGEQRFGSIRHVNHLVGKCLLLGDFESAVLRLTAADESSHGHGSNFESALISHLKRNPADYLGVVRKLPLRMTKLFVHAYQAHIWNMAVMEYSKSLKSLKNHKHVVIPIVGYKTSLGKYPETKGIVEGILARECVKTADFRNRKFPELSSKGTERDFLAFAKNLSYAFAKDEMNPGKMKMILDFELAKGSYGTEFVRQICTDKSGK
jgi:tRNA pseudouridine13 synthase